MDIVCVSGMHRSGTSLVSRIVNLLGVDLGEHESLLPPSEDNPGGFWENSEIKRVNDRVLRTLGGSWHEPPALPEDWQNDPVLDPARKDAVAVLTGEARASELFGWKDPRTSLTLPFWLTVTRVRGNIVCLRPPTAVAVSLAQRNGFTAEKSAGLWILYTLNAWLSHPHRLLVMYDDVISQVEESATRMARHLNLADPDTETLRQVRDVVDPSLDHRSGRQSGSGPLMELAENLMSLLTAADDAAVRPAMESMDRLTRARRLTDELVVRDPHEASAEAIVEEQVGATKASLRALQRLVAARVERAEVERRRIARTEMNRLRREERKARTELEERAAELEATASERDELRDRLWMERQAAQQEVAQVRAELEDLRKDAAAARERVQEAESRASVAEAARKSAEQQGVAARRDFERLRGRRSVKLATSIAQPAKPVFQVVRRTRSSKRNEGARSSTGGGGRSGDRKERTRDAGERPNARVSSSSPTRQRLGRRKWAETADRLDSVDSISIIIPVYNAPGALRRCVDAVIRNTSRQAELFLINDASTDPATGTVLRDVQTVVGVKVRHNETNQGFAATVNRALEETSGDVVILNSDTEVPPRWLENLATCAYHDQAVGTVTALSNNAGAFSAPSLGEENPLPAWLTFDDLGRRVTRTSRRVYPRTPTGNGFCLYIKRRLLDQIGYLDSTNFPRGYGEENDFCMRALSVGWENAVDDATFVAHELAASFGADDRTDLMQQGRVTVDRMHPTYTERVRAFVRSDEMASVREAVADAMGQRDAETPLRVLYVVHSGRGGTPSTNVDLMESLQPNVECLVLECDTKTLRLREACGRELIEIEREELDPPLRFGEFSRHDYRSFAARILVDYAIELIHVRHLVKHTLDIPRLAKSFDIPIVVSLHDYYLACPTVHLLDENDQFCGGTCTAGPGPCRIPMEWIAESAPPLKHEWVYEWRSRVFPLLSGADALVTTTEAAKGPHLEAYPDLAKHRWEIIEHGRDLEQSHGLCTVPQPGGVIRLLLPGNLEVHKGSDFVRQMQQYDEAGRLEFHFLGDSPEELKWLGRDHGKYERNDFVQKVDEIRPSFIGLFSITAETYMHSLTEAWSAGVPVIATDIGALGERLRSKAGGWLVDPDDPQGAYKRLVEIADDPSIYREGLDRASIAGIPTGQAMGEEYLALYRSVLRRRQNFSSPCVPGVWRGRELRVGVVVVGEAGRHPGSAYVRAVRRFSHPDVRSEIVSRIVSLDEALNNLDSWDALYIERTAVPPERTDEAIERTNAGAVPIVLDLDDNLLSDEALHAGGRTEWSGVVESLRWLAASASLVTVSTEPLAVVARQHANQVLVAENMLDERLWFAPLGKEAGRQERGGARGLQLLYMGTRTHERELQMLRPVMERVWAELDSQAVLNVIGGEPDRNAEGWYQRVPVPRGCSTYPEFVTWLRSIRGKWDIAVAPLADNYFNRFKSDLKFLEYGALGLPSVSSVSKAYGDTVKHGETGLLAEDDPDCWLTEIRRLVTEAELGNTMGEAAQRYVLENRTLRIAGREYAKHLSATLFPSD